MNPYLHSTIEAALVIGTRTLTVSTAEGEKAVIIQMFEPEPDGPAWYCRYEIAWPEGTARSKAMGNDALHAIDLALQKIGTDLYMSRYHHDRKMWWIKPWVGYGFPMPKGARDLLIGDDQIYYGTDG